LKKRKITRRFRVKILAETIVQAALDILHFDHRVDKVKMTLKKDDQYLELICRGRGRLKARISKGVADIWVTGTQKQVKAWEEFFSKFAEAPEFSLKQYIQWARG